MFSNKFCTSEDVKTTVLESNCVKLQGYMRNITLEKLNCLRTVETLNLSNFYLLYVYLKDIYYIFLHFVCHINGEELLLKEKGDIKNSFLFNTKIETFEEFFSCLKSFMLCKTNENRMNVQVENTHDAYRDNQMSKKKKKTHAKGIEQSGQMEKQEEGHGEKDDEKSGKKGKEEEKNILCLEESSCTRNLPYANEFLQLLYTTEKIKLFNIDNVVNEKIKKENLFEESYIRINNNISIYKLSYLYFNDKLKRIRLDYMFHLVLANRRKSKNFLKDEHRNKEGNPCGETFFTIYEQLFLVYFSHFKFYIFSFLLYSYMRHVNPEKGGTHGGSGLGTKGEFLYNSEDNLKNLGSVVSHILHFINTLLHNIHFFLKRENISSNQDENSSPKDKGNTYNRERINDILKKNFFFKIIHIEHIDLALSCIVLLNIQSHDYLHSYFYLDRIYDDFMHTFEKYGASISLWKNRKEIRKPTRLRRANYFRFFEDVKTLSLIERCALFPNLKNIRLECLYGILHSANNRNKYSLTVKLIDEYLNFCNIERTTYFLNCLSIQVERGRVSFNMSNRANVDEKSRCFLLDNKNECIKNFLKLYRESIEDYVYIIYQEKTFDEKKCFSKFDVPYLIYFGE
ncbi:conserved Plasmodium protein, unknown function [Plasmodium ovale]|uniref:Uncharacterized protein n=1 Tax=Plasmodium ovale TaxID=36330 RepID=A0A1D3U815_PLAOA|nr:conserved Plasmodium protein, unknown function [Plasmodium ovale]